MDLNLMSEEAFDAYMDPTIEKAEALTERVKDVLREEGAQAALLAAESIVVFDLTDAERAKMLALAITIVAQTELER